MPSTYAKQSFLNKTLTGTLNASFNGKAMRLNPTGVELGYTVKTSETPTLGGMVVQVFGVEMSDLIVSGTFGVGGWKEQETFLNEMVALAQAQGTHGTLDPSQGPVRFVYPQRNFDFQVYLKEYASMGGLAIDFENTNIAPDWQLTLFIDTDNTGGALTKVAGDAYIARLAKGLGYQLNPFNGNLSTADIEAFLQSQGFPNDLKGYINAAFGSPVSTPSAPGGSTPPASGGGPANATAPGALSYGAIEGYWIAAGGQPAVAAIMAAIAMAESGGDPSVVQKGQPPETTGWGLWQITPTSGSPGPYSRYLNALVCAQQAVALASGGSNLGPWSTYNSGAYKKFLQNGVPPIAPPP